VVPTISAVADQSAFTGVTVGPLAFTVGDAETAAAQLVVTVTSSNTSLVPVTAVTVGGSGANRTVTVTSTAGLTGSAVVTLTVWDGGGASAAESFILTVTNPPPPPPAPNTPPTITDVADQSLAFGTASGALLFAVGDAQTLAGQLSVFASSSNALLLPLSGIGLGGSGAVRSVTFTPTAGQSGTAVVTITVADTGGLTATDTVIVTVAAPPPPVVPPVVPPAVPPAVPPVVPPPPPASPPLLAPAPFLIGGAADGTVRVLNGSLGGPIAALPGLGVNARTATADVTGDSVPDYIVGAGPGSVPRVVVLDGKTGQPRIVFSAFEDTFAGGVFVAAADIDGDGMAEVVVTPDESGGPVVAVYRGAPLAAGVGGQAAQLTRFFGIAGDPNFRGGCRPALGDIDGDGAADLVVSAGVLGGPRIAIFDGQSLKSGSGDPGRLVGDFFAFEDTLRNGAFVAAGDVTADGHAEVAFGGGPGGAPRVRLFDGQALLAAPAFSNVDAIAGSAQRANFFAGDVNLRGGVRLALHDLDADARADLATGSGAAESSHVRIYKSATLLAGADSADLDLDPFGTVLANGVFVG
jgi:hypothetical protein